MCFIGEIELDRKILSFESDIKERMSSECDSDFIK